MKKYVNGKYIPMTPEEITEREALSEIYKVEFDEATEADYQNALRDMEVKL